MDSSRGIMLKGDGTVEGDFCLFIIVAVSL